MLKNYLKIAWRNIAKSKGYSALNILGLASGMSVALLIGLWVFNEYSYDRYLPNYEQAYQVRRNYNANGDTLNFTSTTLKLADALRNQIPEIEFVAETDWMGPHGLIVGDKKIVASGGHTGSDFLKIFQFPLVEGQRDVVMKDPYSIILTRSTAKALFGETPAMNKTVRFDNQHELKVTGILEDLPANASFQFKFLVPFSFLEQTNPYVKANRNGSFGDNSYQVFASLKPGVSYAQVAPKIRNIEHTENNNINAKNSYVVMQPLSRWHLFENYVNGKDVDGFIVYVRMFTIIGALVLLIACINFINLTTARSEKRAREVGVRKAIGSQRKDLVFQFLIESFLLTAIAFLFSLVITQSALPFFNMLTERNMHLPWGSAPFWLIVLTSVLITALMAGSRPAFYLSSFNPVKVLKGGLQAGKHASWSRKVLVVMQFSCSIALIISTVVVYRQIQYAKDRPTGFEVNRLMSTDMNHDLGNNYIAVRDELLKERIVDHISTASSPSYYVGWHTDIDQWEGKQPGETVEMGAIITGDDYFNTLGMKIIAGRDFIGPADTLNVIFNEAAIKRLRLKNPVNKTIVWDGVSRRIVGIARDALMVSPFASADPTMFFHSTGTNSNIMYRLAPGIGTKDAIAKMTSIFNKYNPAFPFTYEFADRQYAAKFNLEMLIGKLAGIFAGLAIFISCLGLFGLAAYVAEQRTKEIGIRKVLGASVPEIWMLLSRDFILLVSLSCVIASLLAFNFLQQWLLKYDYRISMGPWIFIGSALIAILITLVTISFQAIRAALMNPVMSLRSE